MNIKSSALILSLATALWAVPAASAADDGDIDNSFGGGDGRLITDLGGTHANTGPKAAIDGAGRLVLAGVFGGNIGVGRFNPDGSPDLTFAGDGNVEVDSGATSGGERARAVVIQDDGKILIFGDASISASSDTSDLVLARLNENGTLDNTFDGPSGTGNGVFRLDLNEAGETASDVLMSGTKIVIGGHAGSPLAPYVVRLESNGTVDSDEFATGSNGVLTWAFPGGASSFLSALALQVDGKIVAAGSPNSGTNGVNVARITTAGALDTETFGSGTGYVQHAAPAPYFNRDALDILVDGDQKIVVAGTASGLNGLQDPFVGRLTNSGAADSSFDGDGFAVHTLGNDGDTSGANSIVRQPDGALLIAGTVGPTSPVFALDQFVARFTSTGALDASFSPDAPAGTAVVHHPGVSVQTSGLALSGGGIAYVAGLTGTGDPSKVAIGAVCATVPPACPSPETPGTLTVTPAGGGNDNQPRVRGLVPAGAAVTGVTIYTDAACAGPVAAMGSQAAFEASGIQVSVPDNSTTTFYAKANGHNGDSGCSAGVEYTEVTPPSATPNNAPLAAKKCKKAKKLGAKKRKCKKRK